MDKFLFLIITWGLSYDLKEDVEREDMNIEELVKKEEKLVQKGIDLHKRTLLLEKIRKPKKKKW